jgi:hypothetical protein
MKEIKKNPDRFSHIEIIACVVVLVILIVSIVVGVQLKKKRLPVPPLQLDNNLVMPEFIYENAFNTSPFYLNIKEPSSAEVYYTTDGTEPTLSSMHYTGPLRIDDRTPERNKLSVIPTSPRWKPPIGNVFKGTVVRAIAVNENRKSKESIKTFFVSGQGKEKYTVPVIALTVNEKHLFGYHQGIYVLGKTYVDKDNYIRKYIPLDIPWWEYPSNYLWRGMDSERPAHIEFYDPLNPGGFEAHVGIRIHGNATRGFAQKSLRVCFRKKYGQEKLKYALFPDTGVKEFSSFILRNSGNDWNKTMFRDAFMQDLMKGTMVDVQAYRPSVVFINGEYWGIHNIRERFDENYLADKYHLKKDSVVILELSGRVIYGDKSDQDDFSDLLAFVKKNDLSKKINYETVLKQIDIRSFIDFVIANVYFCNSDWPNNNVKFWRSTSSSDSLQPADGRWRWMLYDTDWGFGYNSASSGSSNLLNKAMKEGSVGILFTALLNNKDFKADFISRFQFLLNSAFKTDVCLQKIETFKNQLAPEMPEHIRRWRAIDGYNEWLENIEVLKDFAQKRPKIQADQLNDFFHLTGSGQFYIEK